MYHKLNSAYRDTKNNVEHFGGHGPGVHGPGPMTRPSGPVAPTMLGSGRPLGPTTKPSGPVAPTMLGSGRPINNVHFFNTRPRPPHHPRPPPNWGNRPWNYRPIWGNNYSYMGWNKDYLYWYPGYYSIYEQPLWYVFYDTIDNYGSINKEELKKFILSLPTLCKSEQCNIDITNYLNMFNVDYIINDRNLLSNLLVNIYNRLSTDL
jgi:hypothetical protein